MTELNVYGHLNQFLLAVETRNVEQLFAVEENFKRSELVDYGQFWTEHLQPALDDSSYGWLVTQIYYRAELAKLYPLEQATEMYVKRAKSLKRND